MSLLSEILENYIDANGLVCPWRCKRTDINPTGNGVCYTGEFVTMLALEGELSYPRRIIFAETMQECMRQTGLLARGPGQPDLESVDDYYGFAAGVYSTDMPFLAEQVIRYGWRHLGSFNSVEPGKWTTETFLWRQPQLICALYAAAKRAPLWIYPLRVYTAAVIALSCIRAEYRDADARRLNWLLIHTVAPTSWLCRQAAKIWFRRLEKQYGPAGMRAVAATYYEVDPAHPFIKYWPLGGVK